MVEYDSSAIGVLHGKQGCMWRHRRKMAVFLLTATSYIAACILPAHVKYDQVNSRGLHREGLGSNTSTIVHAVPGGILIGVRKAGTGALIRFLSLNPHIKTAPEEVHFFDTEENYARGTQWYLHRLPATGAGEISFEKSPKYFHTKSVPARIHSFNPGQKLLVILRDPIQRLISEHYFIHYLVAIGKYSHTTFIRRYGNLSFSQCVLDPRTGEVDPTYNPLDRSHYYRHLSRWLAVFPRSQLHVIDGDAYIRDNPALALRRVERFLGVQPHINKSMFVYNREKGFYCPATTGCLPGKGHHHPQPTTAAMEALQRYFKPLNQKLYKLIRQRFDW